MISPKKYRISETALAVLTADLDLRGKIAEALDVIKQTVYSYMLTNKPNGLLTTIGVVETIIENTNLSREQIVQLVPIEEPVEIE